jgi:hypothetical protein
LHETWDGQLVQRTLTGHSLRRVYWLRTRSRVRRKQQPQRDHVGRDGASREEVLGLQPLATPWRPAVRVCERGCVRGMTIRRRRRHRLGLEAVQNLPPTNVDADDAPTPRSKGDDAAQAIHAEAIKAELVALTRRVKFGLPPTTAPAVRCALAAPHAVCGAGRCVW